MKIERIWAMPNKWTFTIKPINDLLLEEIGAFPMFIKGIWLDPFAGMNSPAQIRNDLNPKANAEFHEEALEFLKKQKDNSVDGILLDPPYSPRQLKECYENIGKSIEGNYTQCTFWSEIKNESARILKPNGKAICFGWSSMGLGINRGFEMTRILLVPHGGSKNDTICTVEIKK
jgi:hypothetical protein